MVSSCRMKELLLALYVRDDLGIHWSLRILRASCIPQLVQLVGWFYLILLTNLYVLCRSHPLKAFAVWALRVWLGHSHFRSQPQICLARRQDGKGHMGPQCMDSMDSMDSGVANQGSSLPSREVADVGQELAFGLGHLHNLGILWPDTSSHGEIAVTWEILPSDSGCGSVQGTVDLMLLASFEAA